MNITELALDCGFDADDEVTMRSLERFAALVIEAHTRELLAGSGEPAVWFDSETGAASFVKPLRPTYEPCYTADQMAAAVLRYEKDAERYRWLRSLHWEQDLLGVVVRPKTHTKLGCFIPSEQLLDETIDHMSKGDSNAE